MDSTKACRVKWSEISEQNFRQYLNHYDNGFAIITGHKYFVIDFDSKHNPPQEIYELLWENCKAVEKTPGGFHFWFLNDSRTSHLVSTTDASWDNNPVKGIDIRARGGIVYCAPTRYSMDSGEVKRYTWLKGILSTCEAIPNSILEHLSVDVSESEPFSFSITGGLETIDAMSTVNTDEIVSVLNGLSYKRIDNYNDWILVGMALKNSGYSCDLWDDWSKKSAKYRPCECYKKWRTFSEKIRPITQASLYDWLKVDNYELFVSLKSSSETIQTKLLAATNASIAEAFYEMNPNKYLYSTVDGWYILQDNNTWVSTGSTDIMSIPNILNSIRFDCSEVLVKIMRTQNRNKNEDGSAKGLADAYKKISSAGFLKGAAAFLPGLYHTQDVERLFNEKRNLFAFSNGVHDISNFEFRMIEPEDYITVTCGYDYKEISVEDKNKVRAFLKKIWPNEAVLQYNLGGTW